MARPQLGAAPSRTTDTVTKTYSDSTTQTLTNKNLTDTTNTFPPTLSDFDALTTRSSTTLATYDFVTGATQLEIQSTHVLEIATTSSLEIYFAAAGVITNPTVVGYLEGVQALGTVGSGTVVLSLVRGTIITATLTASTTTPFIMPPPVAGQSFSLLLKQPSVTGNGVATFAGAVKWPSAGAPTITVTAGAADQLAFICHDGINWYGSYSQGYTY